MTLGFGRLPEGVSAGAPSSATVQLKDNDAARPDVEVYFSGTSSETPEGQSVAVHVYTDADLDERLSIPIGVEHLGGAGPEDYMGVPANVTIPAGERRGHVAVMVLEDAEAGEHGEGIRLQLRRPAGGGERRAGPCPVHDYLPGQRRLPGGERERGFGDGVDGTRSRTWTSR